MSVRFHGRREDFRLVTGQGRFTADWSLPGEAFGHFLRADRAHAEIVAIDTSAALAMAGVLAVLTGADTAAAGFGSAPPLVRYPGKGGTQIKVPRREVMAEQRVRFVGQEVALVVATDAAIAQAAAEQIIVEYRDLPAVTDAAAALAADAPQLYAEIGGNLSFDFDYGDAAKTEEAFAKAAHVTRLVLDAPRLVGNPMEPKACIATYDPATGIYDLYVPSQGLTLMRDGLAGGTGIAADKLRIHAHDVGGGFGIRGEAYSEYCSLMLAAKKVGRPVKWVSTRAETFLSDHHGRAANLQGELALDAEGHFLGVRFLWIVNGGAYLSQPGPLINTLPPAMHAVNLYRIPAVYGLHRLVLTNTTPTTAYRGAARPNVSYLVERLVEEAAAEMHIDRIALRRLNLIPKEAFPYKTLFNAEYDSGDPAGLLDEALARADWAGFAGRRAVSKESGKLRGIACCLFVEPAGGGGSPVEETAIKFGESGNPTLYSMSGPSGQGHETVFPEIVGEILGLDPLTIDHRASDPDGPPLRGDGTIGSRSLMSHGSALVATAREVIRKGTDLAAQHLEVASADVEFVDGTYRVRGTDVAIAFAELARLYAGSGPHPLDSCEAIPVPRAFPTGAHVAEVEVDQETGEIDVVTYVAVDDCGRIINHTLAEGQIHGGIMQGLGQVLIERCVYDAAGQPITGSFMDYGMPRADDLGELRLYDRSIPSPNNVLGAKGVGEAGTTGAVPTLASAVIDALRPLGISHVDLPYTPGRIWNAIAARK